MADPKVDDLVVNIAESPSASFSKPGAEAPKRSPVQRGKDWLNAKPRNKWLAGGALGSLLLLPVIIAPAVVASQKAQQQAAKKKVPDWGAYRSVGSKSVYLDPLVSRAPAAAHTCTRSFTRTAAAVVHSVLLVMAALQRWSACGRRAPRTGARRPAGGLLLTRTHPTAAHARQHPPPSRPNPPTPPLPTPRATPTLATPAPWAATSCPPA